jgi:hypothetical protein
MKSRTLASAVHPLSLLLFVSVTCALAQERRPVHLTGLINDYSPANPLISGSPYEMHGQWSMDVHPEWGTADFSADMTMSGYGTTNGVLDATKGGAGAHTHHVRLTSAKIVWNMTGCPTYATSPQKMGFQFTDTVSLMTGIGNNAPFETNPPSSTLQVCVLGGDDVQYSIPHANITLVFGGPAGMKHFGQQAIDQSDDCSKPCLLGCSSKRQGRKIDGWWSAILGASARSVLVSPRLRSRSRTALLCMPRWFATWSSSPPIHNDTRHCRLQ